jgi:hypothetical protein
VLDGYRGRMKAAAKLLAALSIACACTPWGSSAQTAVPGAACAAPAFDVLAQRIASNEAAELRRRLQPYLGCSVDWTLRGFGGEETSGAGARDPAPEPHLWLSRQRLISANIALGDLCTVDASSNPVIVALPRGHGAGWEHAQRPNLVRVTGRIWGSDPGYGNHVYLRDYTVTLISRTPVEERRMCGQ